MITNEMLQEHQEMWEEYLELQELQSDNIKTIKAQHENDKVVVIDPETKKEVEVLEKDLWLEMHYDGVGDNRAANYLRSKYQDIFEREEKLIEFGKKVAKFEVNNFGAKFKEMTPPAMIQLINALIRKELSEQLDDTFEFLKDPAKAANQIINDYRNGK